MLRLRYAVLCDGDALEAWQLRCLDLLDGVADLAGLIVAPSQAARRLPERGATGRERSRLSARSPAEVAERLRNIPRYDLEGVGSTESSRFDFVLKLCRGPVPPGLEHATRLGVWYFEHELQASSLPFFQEVYDGEDVTRAALLALQPGQREPGVLEEGFFPTDVRSYRASRDRILAAVAAWPARSCRGAGETKAARSAGAAAQVSGNPPASVSSLRYRVRIARRRLVLAWQRLFRHPQWNIGVLHVPVDSLVTSGYDDGRIEWLPLDGRTTFLADPFAVARGSTLHVLCERFRYRESKGHICALEIKNGRPSPVEDVIEGPTHLSYPFLVEDGNEIYCIPESEAAGQIALFRADDFPRTWSEAAVLVPGFPGVDPTVFFHDGRWWLFSTKGGALADVELWAWHAPALFGPWTPHARNPVKSDVRGSRPGGRPFHHEGALYRPAQDCSKRYGWRVAVQRVTRLTPWEFAEEQVQVLEAAPQSPFPLGRHTLTVVGDTVLVDGLRDVFVWQAFRAFLAIWASDWSRRAAKPRRPRG